VTFQSIAYILSGLFRHVDACLRMYVNRNDEVEMAMIGRVNDTLQRTLDAPVLR
jgi:hypothetical protein